MTVPCDSPGAEALQVLAEQGFILDPDEDGETHATRDRLLEAAVRLFAERGFDACTMRDLAAAAGIKAPAIYNHFASKEELLALSSRSGLARFFTTVIGPMVDEDPADQLEGMVRRWVRFQIDNADVARANDALLDTGVLRRVLRPEDWAPIGAAINALMLLLRRLTIEAGAGGVNPSLTAHCIAGVCDRTSLWYRPGRPLTVEDVADETWTLVKRMTEAAA